MQIFLTWTDKRTWLPTYGKPLAALWVREGGRRDLKKAEAYVRTENEKGSDHRVYSTSTYELFAVAKAEALAAHKGENNARS